MNSSLLSAYDMGADFAGVALTPASGPGIFSSTITLGGSMSDTKRIIKPSEAQTIARKPPSREIGPVARRQVLYQFTWQRREPREIAGRLQVQTDQVNDVIRMELRRRESPEPPTPGQVIQFRRAA